MILKYNARPFNIMKDYTCFVEERLQGTHKIRIKIQ